MLLSISSLYLFVLSKKLSLSARCQESIQPNRNHSIDKEEVNNSKDEAGKEATNNTNLK